MLAEEGVLYTPDSLSFAEGAPLRGVFSERVRICSRSMEAQDRILESEEQGRMGAFILEYANQLFKHYQVF